MPNYHQKPFYFLGKVPTVRDLAFSHFTVRPPSWISSRFQNEEFAKNVKPKNLFETEKNLADRFAHSMEAITCMLR